MPDDLFSFDPRLKARTTDPRTAKWAALANLPLKDTQRREILEIHLDHPAGLTDDECSRFTTIRLNSLSTRRSELERGGWLEDTGMERKTRQGVFAVVWRVTTKAKLALPRLEFQA